METFFTIFASLGGGVILKSLVDTFIKWVSGKHGLKHDGWRYGDSQARKRRIEEEYVHELRLFIREHGLDPPDHPLTPKSD